MCVWAHKDSRGNPARSHKRDIKIVDGPLASLPSRTGLLDRKYRSVLRDAAVDVELHAGDVGLRLLRDQRLQARRQRMAGAQHVDA